MDATTDLIIYAPLITALVQVVYQAAPSIPDRTRGLAAMLAGVALAGGFVATTDAEALPAMLNGIGAGLAATGVYEATRTRVGLQER